MHVETKGQPKLFFDGWKTIHCLHSWFSGLKILPMIVHNRMITEWDYALIILGI